MRADDAGAAAASAALVAVLVGTMGPVLRATKDPLPAMLRGAPTRANERGRTRWLAAFGVAVASVGALLAARSGSFAVLAMFAGCAAIAPFATQVLVGIFRWCARPFGVLAMLAVDQATTGGRRVALSATALAAAVSMCLAVSIYTRSYEHAIEDWADGAVPADILVTSGSPLLDRGASPFVVAPESMAAVRAIDGVRRLSAVRSQQMRVAGLVTDVLCVDSRAYLSGRAARGALRVLEGRRAVATDGLLSVGAAVPVLVSETFAAKSGRHAGDELVVVTSTGPVTIRIAAVVAEYSTTRGWMLIDERDAERVLGHARISALAISTDDPSRAAAVADAVRFVLGAAGDGLFVSTREELHGEILRVARRSLAIARAGQWSVLVIALLAMVCATVGSALDRREDHALLRTLGASPAQVAAVAAVEAGVLALAATIAGIASSIPLARVFLDGAGREATGWHVPLVVPASSVLLTALAVVVLCVAAGFPVGLASARRPLLRALPV